MAVSERQRAVVIGASMAGLLAARVLSDHFSEVEIIDRDRLPDGPEFRNGVPQSRHAHALLRAGLDVLDRLFPGFSTDLEDAGAVPMEPPRDLPWLNARSEEHTSELQSLAYLVCRLLLEKKKKHSFPP